MIHIRLRLGLVALVSWSLAATAIAQTSTEVPAYKARAVSRTDGDVRVSVAALSAAESEAVYGVPLADRSIQPVWVEVDNQGEHTYWLMSPGLDPNFFAVSEAAEAFSGKDKNAANAERENRFRQLALRNPVPPGRSVPAFVRRGWSPTESTWSGSVTRMVTSALSGERYPYAPVSTRATTARSSTTTRSCPAARCSVS